VETANLKRALAMKPSQIVVNVVTEPKPRGDR
jgi:hypothetical protein